MFTFYGCVGARYWDFSASSSSYFFKIPLFRDFSQQHALRVEKVGAPLFVEFENAAAALRLRL